MVKLHHSFLLAALGIAATASAAAIANGGEQVTDLARRFVDKHAETLAARQHDKHRRSLYPDDTLEPSASKQKFEAILFAELDKQLDEQFATIGHCSGPESPTCQHNSCMLGDAGCTAYSRDEQCELSARTKQLVLKVLTLGRCTPSSANAEHCTELGYCNYWQWHPKVDQTVGCEPLHKRDQQQLFAKLRPQPDGTYDFVDDVKAHDDEGSTRASSDEPRAKKVPRTFGKRSLASNDERVSPQEAPETQAADDTVEYFGTKLNKNQLAQEVVNAAAQVTDITYKQYGRCAPDSDSCQGPICKRRHSGCLPFSEEKKAEIEENFIAIYAQVLFSGSCDPATGSKNNNCDEEGRCELWTDDGKRDHDCKSLDQMEMIDRLHAELQQLDALGAQNEGHAGSDSHSDKVKRHVSSDEGAQTATFHGVPMTKKQVDLLAEQAAEQATAITFNGLGYCDEASTTCREETCHLDTEGCIAYPSEVIDEYEHEVAALYRRVFSSGSCDASAAAAAATADSESSNCDENGQCKLWLKNGSRDPRCNELTSKQLQSRLRAEMKDLFAPDEPDAEAGAGKRRLQKRDLLDNLDHGLFKRAASSQNDRDTVTFHDKSLTYKQLMHLAGKAAVQSTADVFDKIGHCDPASSTCRDGSCSLDEDGCTAYSDEVQREYYLEFRIIYSTVLNLGSCDPKDNDGNCQPNGECELFSRDGVRDHACAEPTSEETEARLEAAWEKAFAQETPDAGAHETGLHKRATTSSEQSDELADFHGTKLSLVQVYQLADKAASDLVTDAFEHQGYCKAKSSSCRADTCKPGTDDCIAYPNEIRQPTFDVYQAIFREAFASGICDASGGEGRGNCDKSGECRLWVLAKRDSSCHTMTPPQVRSRLEAVYERVMANSDKSLRKRAVPAANDDQVAVSHGSNSVLFNGVAMTQAQVEQQAVRLAAQATEETTKDAGVCAPGSSTCREQYCQLPAQDCIAYSDEEKQQLEQALGAVLVGVFTSGSCRPAADGGKADNCDEQGWCELWLKDGQRDFSCKPLRKKQLGERLQQALNAMYASGAADTGPSAGASDGTSHKEDTGADKAKLQKRGVVVVGQHLLKRDYSMAEPEPYGDDAAPTTPPAGFITVNKADLLSSAKLYQPTPEELDDFMAVCAQLASDPEALDQIAEDAGVDDDDAKQLLREHFAELAHDKDAATQVMQQAKMAQMVRESKGTGASTNDAAVGAAAVAKLRKAGGAGAGGTGAAANAELGGLKVDDHGDGSAAQ
ncbi:conserved hypothetical protein [Sporisorium reilianum SRZ2]|uniref:Uncharacterized protein n=1 Tax=Sporisorium reilianum (strain SRZ2) TaxID=999809 RepID=E7A204_SPORE|nr:conserved hypothetical protein [Sporisorium reilianum SRZ2]